MKSSNLSDLIIVWLYVDDLLITGSNEKEISDFKRSMMVEFEMSDLGKLSYFLGMEFSTTRRGIFLHQKKYVVDILKKFNMSDCKPVSTPIEIGIRLTREGDDDSVNPTLYRQLVCSLRYMCNTRPDLAFRIGLISRFMERPRTSRFVAAKRILIFLKGTPDFGLLLPNEMQPAEEMMIGYTDSD